jgi:hypothetical protein
VVGTYVENLFPSGRKPTVVPAEAWTGQKQNISHLVPFGSIGFAHVAEETSRGKLDDRGRKVQIVGYDGRGVYLAKVWDSNEVIRVRNVVWERTKGRWIVGDEGKDKGNDDHSSPTIEEAEAILNQMSTSLNQPASNSIPIQTDPNSITDPSKHPHSLPDRESQPRR